MGLVGRSTRAFIHLVLGGSVGMGVSGVMSWALVHLVKSEHHSSSASES